MYSKEVGDCVINMKTHDYLENMSQQIKLFALNRHPPTQKIRVTFFDKQYSC